MPRPTIIENTEGAAQKGYIYGCGLGYSFGEAAGNGDGTTYAMPVGEACGCPRMRKGILIGIGSGYADGDGDGDGEGEGDGYGNTLDCYIE